ncbi:MAG: hypothetical protein ABIG44_00905 [Planctomycetota bacterium]
MIRMGLAVTALGLLALFGYFFVTASDNQSSTDRAKQAVGQVGDTVRDQGVAGLVRARLASKLGLDEVRFLHVHYDENRVLIYGLLSPDLSDEELAALARDLPGVEEVEIRVMDRPEYMHPDNTSPPDGD